MLEFAFSGGRCCCQVPVGFLLKLRLDLISVLPLCFTQAPRYSEGHFGVFVRKSFLLCLLSSPVGLLCVCEGLLSCVRPSRGFPLCVCPGAENDPDVSVQLKRTNTKLVDHHDLHTHTHIYRNPPQGSPCANCYRPAPVTVDIFLKANLFGISFTALL